MAIDWEYLLGREGKELADWEPDWDPQGSRGHSSNISAYEEKTCDDIAPEIPDFVEKYVEPYSGNLL